MFNLKPQIMKKVFAIVALVTFLGAIATPAVSAAYSAPITSRIIDDKPKKGSATTSTQKKADGSSEQKASCTSGEKKACCEGKKECTGTEKK
jgi:hypothetical protein